MTTVLIGHRGTGKTTFLRALEKFAHDQDWNWSFFDLDQEIERRQGALTAEIFAQGEEKFRQLEGETLNDLIMHADRPQVIALGAGFEGPMPEDAHVVWLRRATDAAGRSFLNRPRLETNVSPLAEYKERFFVRDRRFADWAHEELILPEGYEGGLEELLISGRAQIPCDLTVLPENFRDWPAFVKKREVWGLRRFELRDDLLSSEQIALAVHTLPAERILYSHRKSSASEKVTRYPSDWALELGEPPHEAQIISLHERDEDFPGTLARISNHKGHLKLAVEVKDFTELRAGHEWWKQNPEGRSFLPRSHDGRWRWYRSLFGPQMGVHFVREGEGSSLDQPPLWQVLLQPPFKDKFAAVLGTPVEHSRSPLEHRGFCKDIPFVSVTLPEEEFSVGLQFLRDLGLKFAAVTSPLKKQAWAQAHQLSKEARQTQAVNTLYFDRGTILAHNTDVLALQALRQELPSLQPVWLWGGGGVKSSLKKVWPELIEISARQGTTDNGAPGLVIWATGRSRPFQWPASTVRPELIIDLNYSDDSPGLEWAVRENLPYQSGLRMFKLQAEFQRVFWAACERGEPV